MSEIRKYTIATANPPGRKATRWTNEFLTFEGLRDRITRIFPTSETAQEYIKMPKAKRDDIKDVGGFVGGYLQEGRRRAGAVKYRSILTLDADNAEGDLAENFESTFQCQAWIYSTHSHTEEKPRYRIVIPLARDVTPDEYVAIAHKVMNTLGRSQFDPTCHQPERLMFWCSHSSDVNPVMITCEGDFLNPDSILSHYSNWRDTSEWKSTLPVAPPKDPLEKKGVVGAFCRAYSVPEAIEEFIPDVYRQEHGDRYTYTNGSSFGGLVIYEDGKFGYSNHATDPAGMQLCNAFDLVRIHLFWQEDINLAPDTPATKLASYKAMRDLALTDEKVRKLMATEKLTEAGLEFDEEKPNWLSKLQFHKNGAIISNAHNLELIFNNDPHIGAGLCYLDIFAQRFMLARKPAWRDLAEGRCWMNLDAVEVREYLDKTYGITHKDKIKDAFISATSRNARHPVREYLNSLKWDGKPRLDTVLIDYLGANDSEYTRTVTRKFLTAAVARIFQPGIKFDNILVTAGPQGIGKTLLPTLMGGEWFNNSLEAVKGKPAYEALKGAWIVEMGELTATKRADIEAVKHFISKQEDRYRPAYGEYLEYFPRQCVFWGTTNEIEFLHDRTGNRRFWVVTCTGNSKAKAWDLKQSTIDQIWAEAVYFYNAGEPLFLDRRMETIAMEVQEEYTSDNELIGVISEFLDAMETRRDKTCIVEIIEDCLGEDVAQFPITRKNDVRAALNSLPGWTRHKTGAYGKLRFGKHGLQRAWVRN